MREVTSLGRAPMRYRVPTDLHQDPIASFAVRISYTRALATDHVILNHGQVTWTTLELAPALLTTTPHQREDVSALDRFNVHRCPTRRVFSGTGIELVTRQATIRNLYHKATAAVIVIDFVIFSLGQMTKTTPEVAYHSPLFYIMPTKELSASIYLP
ncbi:uncharacterized protein TNCV_3412221 [Trichonephila clavipes]|uniref:Uncharacterized protein n=1 Tax=Trichonephila clavipes TaxID=2585209 RepID=A0A8X6RJS4_TRICX|nr:uncharacterized protein TNCV_3412221 [Trichonephila clavipes]